MLSTTTLTGHEILLVVVLTAALTFLVVAGIYELLQARDRVDEMLVHADGYADGFLAAMDLVGVRNIEIADTDTVSKTDLEQHFDTIVRD